MTSIDNNIHNIRNLLSRINSIFEIISEDGFEEELNEKFLKSLKDLEENWLDYTNKLKNE
tara:strand:- start:60 stop:239 length:180 start_codon:yes stop_codon:yes gene_type:complete